MTDFYTNMASIAQMLLAKFGRPLQVRRTAAGTYDPVTGAASGETTTYADTTGVFVKITQDYAASNEVQQGDRLLMLDASVAPEMTDAIMIGASPLTIVNIVPINPAGTPIAYKVQIRGAVDESADGGNFTSIEPTRTFDGGDFG